MKVRNKVKAKMANTFKKIIKKRKKKKKDFRKELGDVLKANPEDFDEKGDDANEDCK